MRLLILPTPQGTYKDAENVTYNIIVLSDTANVSGPHQPVTAVSEAEAASQAGLTLLLVAPRPPRPVSKSISSWQAKAALALTPHPQAGTMLVAAEAALNAMPEGQGKIVVLSAWANNANFERQSPTILSFGEALGMDSESLDNLFRLGSSLTV